MFSVMYTGMNLLPLWTASVCPTNSGEIVEARAHVLMTRFSPRAFIAWIFSRSRASMYGPFLIDRAMGLPSLLPFPVRYDVALPRRRPRTMYLFDSLFRRRVFLPSGLDRKSTRLNSSHVKISYAVFCLKKKTRTDASPRARSLCAGRCDALLFLVRHC